MNHFQVKNLQFSSQECKFFLTVSCEMSPFYSRESPAMKGNVWPCENVKLFIFHTINILTQFTWNFTLSGTMIPNTF